MGMGKIDEAFLEGDLEARSRAAVDDPDAIPNGQMPITVGSCLVYAIYHSPLAFICTLLEIGADRRASVNDRPDTADRYSRHRRTGPSSAQLHGSAANVAALAWDPIRSQMPSGRGRRWQA